MNIGRLVPLDCLLCLCLRSVGQDLVRLWLVKRSTPQYQQETLEISWCLYAKQIGLPVGSDLLAQMSQYNVLTDFL